MSFKSTFGIKTESKSNKESVTIIGNIRISVLTDCLIRVENGNFTDEPTQTVLFRNFTAPVYKIKNECGKITVSTKRTVLCVSATDGKFIYAKTRDCGKTEKISDNLKGTYRTLDMSSGEVDLGDGIISKSGVAVLDDSKTFLLSEEGTIEPRLTCSDIYYFAYGRNYREALKDFYRLCGETPLLPRYCFGNWWSRYWAYTQEEYLSLMEKFKKESIPLTVATVDMDWHWVKVVQKFGMKASNLLTKRVKGEKHRFFLSGWTGYSWNTELFPDYKAFLRELHERGLKTTLNIHPAAGVKFYEDQYEEMAAAMSINPETKEHVPFDITDPKFIEAYFEILHHKYEEDGVDFWWIDWQQGNKTKIPGLDPLWPLNHYHYLDNCRNGKRGLTLSRFAGPGSHRYPLGFSGDTAISFKTLAFQPYFTITASNIGYTWWSHDIGGHHMGIHNDEIYIRWLQFGVFSPINRLHSTSDSFMGKEPWNYRPETEETAKQWLRLRKRLIPYIYTANRETHVNGKALLEPMYYEFPLQEDAYKVKNQYIFGGSLIVAPITEPCDKASGLAGTDVYLDGKRYTDIFTGDIYSYSGINRQYRYLNLIPVLAPEGSIIPIDTDDTSNGSENPKHLELLIFNGNGEYKLYEDDGETLEYKNGIFAERLFAVKEEGNILSFTISPLIGDKTVVPEKRDFTLSFRNIKNTECYTINGTEKYSTDANSAYLQITLKDIESDNEIHVNIENFEIYIPKTKKEKQIELLSRINGNNNLKTLKYTLTAKTGKAMPTYSKIIKNALKEISLQAE